MLAPEDRKTAECLFERLDAVASQNSNETDAMALIEQRMAEDTAAPWYMSQTVHVQEYALSVAQNRIEELEAQLTQCPAGGGLFCCLFGGGQAR